jgi:hypothetical protein
MLDKIESIYVAFGLALRVFLFLQTRIRHYFEDSGEFVTPLNSWKRGKIRLFIGNWMIDWVFLVIEGIYLRKLNLSPFVGSIVHEVSRNIHRGTPILIDWLSFRHHCRFSSIQNYMQLLMDMSKVYLS